jgi:hypothetical protein
MVGLESAVLWRGPPGRHFTHIPPGGVGQIVALRVEYFSSCGHFEEEVEGQEEKDQVGGPGGEEWGELAYGPHGFK